MLNLKSMTDDELHLSTDRAVALEKEAIALTTRHFQEIMNRRAFLPAYASMFEFLTLKHGYCAGSAQIRINALRLIRDLPTVQKKIENGELSLTAAANIQTFLRTESKNDRSYSQNAKIELVEACIGKSTREVQQEFARRNPEIEKRDRIKPTSSERVRLEVSIDAATIAKLNQLRALRSHADPSMSLGDVIADLAELGLDRYCPRRKAARATSRRERTSAKPKANQPQTESGPFHAHETNAMSIPVEVTTAGSSQHASRYIPADERHQVRDDGQGCSFVDAKSKRRCGSTAYLQLDHIQPFSEGGENTAANLRWMCAAHNRWRSQTSRSQFH